ncbi:MAG: DUF4333 domain-containing protein [Aeromicrobium sp.]
MRLTTIAFVLIAFGTASACSVSGSVNVDKSVSTKTLEKQVAAQVTAKEPRLKPQNVACPKKLKAKVGATTSCALLANGLQYNVDLKVTKVKGLHVDFLFNIPPPPVVPPVTLEGQVKKSLDSQIPSGIDTVKCPEGLKGVKGEKTVCDLVANDGSKHPATVTVTDANFFGVDFHMEA